MQPIIGNKCDCLPVESPLTAISMPQCPYRRPSGITHSTAPQKNQYMPEFEASHVHALLLITKKAIYIKFGLGKCYQQTNPRFTYTGVYLMRRFDIEQERQDLGYDIHGDYTTEFGRAAGENEQLTERVAAEGQVVSSAAST